MTGTKDGARQRADQLRKFLGALADDVDAAAARIARAWKLKDHEALGYPTWAEYCKGEYGAQLTKLHVEVRKVWAPILREAGMQTAEIADAMGVDRKTIQRDGRDVERADAEAGATNVALDATQKVADSLAGIDPTGALTGTVPQPREGEAETADKLGVVWSEDPATGKVYVDAEQQPTPPAPTPTPRAKQPGPPAEPPKQPSGVDQLLELTRVAYNQVRAIPDVMIVNEAGSSSIAAWRIIIAPGKEAEAERIARVLAETAAKFTVLASRIDIAVGEGKVETEGK